MKLFPALIIAAFRKKPAPPLKQFLERFGGRTLIIHAGLSIGWVAELLKEAGGGGHFRFDIRNASGTHPTPIEWLVHSHVVAHGLPLPILLRVDADCLRLRHLTRNGRVVHPSEIYWMLREFPARVHLELRFGNGEIIARSGIELEDNRVEFDVGE